MTSDDLAGVWLALAADAPHPGDVRLAPLEARSEAGPIYAGRDGIGQLHLLIPVEPGAVVPSDRRSRGVTINRTELVVAGDRTTFVDVVCTTPDLGDVFQRLATEMLDRIADAPDRAVVVCQDVLGRWRELLERRSASLTAEAAAGLFAELVTLPRLVNLDPARRVDCWTGPTGATHDFVTPDLHLEVKATRRREGRFVEIHGVEQLQKGNSELYLVYMRVEERDDGQRILDLVTELRSAVADNALLTSLLSRAGWDDTDKHAPLIGYSIVEELFYRVDDAFPKIVPASFAHGGTPPGVLRVRYDIDLTGPVPQPLDDTARESLLKRMATRS
ncbi:MAG: hypothetical protein QOD39_934 [Mycobacterium sp.]|nr:hypothetical protein [Mycobacterium sp.]